MWQRPRTSWLVRRLYKSYGTWNPAWDKATPASVVGDE